MVGILHLLKALSSAVATVVMLCVIVGIGGFLFLFGAVILGVVLVVAVIGVAVYSGFQYYENHRDEKRRRQYNQHNPTR